MQCWSMTKCSIHVQELAKVDDVCGARGMLVIAQALPDDNSRSRFFKQYPVQATDLVFSGLPASTRQNNVRFLARTDTTDKDESTCLIAEHGSHGAMIQIHVGKDPNATPWRSIAH